MIYLNRKKKKLFFVALKAIELISFICTNVYLIFFYYFNYIHLRFCAITLSFHIIQVEDVSEEISRTYCCCTPGRFCRSYDAATKITSIIHNFFCFTITLSWQLSYSRVKWLWIAAMTLLTDHDNDVHYKAKPNRHFCRHVCEWMFCACV